MATPDLSFVVAFMLTTARVSGGCNWQCYLDRYPDLLSALGTSNTAGAESHYASTGRAEGRDCTCPAQTPCTSSGSSCVWYLFRAGRYCQEATSDWEDKSLPRCQASACSDGERYVSYIDFNRKCAATTTCTLAEEGSDSQSTYYCAEVAGCNWQCYLDRYPDLSGAFGARNTADAETHYVRDGQIAGRDCTCPAPSPPGAASLRSTPAPTHGCNWQCYLDRYPDLSGAFGARNTADAETHYVMDGYLTGRDCTCQASSPPETPAPLDGCNWQCYLDRYPDLSGAFGTNNTAGAESHYQNVGLAEGRDCTCQVAGCNWQCYLDRYPDVSSVLGTSNTAGAESHYLTAGLSEGRDCFCQAPTPKPTALPTSKYALGKNREDSCTEGTVVTNKTECEVALVTLGYQASRKHVKDGKGCYINGQGKGRADGIHTEYGAFQLICRQSPTELLTPPTSHPTPPPTSNVIQKTKKRKTASSKRKTAIGKRKTAVGKRKTTRRKGKKSRAPKRKRSDR